MEAWRLVEKMELSGEGGRWTVMMMEADEEGERKREKDGEERWGED